MLVAQQLGFNAPTATVAARSRPRSAHIPRVLSMTTTPVIVPPPWRWTEQY